MVRAWVYMKTSLYHPLGLSSLNLVKERLNNIKNVNVRPYNTKERPSNVKESLNNVNMLNHSKHSHQNASSFRLMYESLGVKQGMFWGLSTCGVHNIK